MCAVIVVNGPYGSPTQFRFLTHRATCGRIGDVKNAANTISKHTNLISDSFAKNQQTSDIGARFWTGSLSDTECNNPSCSLAAAVQGSLRTRSRGHHWEKAR